MNTDSLRKLTHDELNAIIDGTVHHQKRLSVFIRKSWKTIDKINGICKLFGDGEMIASAGTVKTMLSLKEFAVRSIKNARTKVIVSKDLLNNLYATLSFREAYVKWIQECPFDNTIAGVGVVDWFSYPEFNEKRNMLEPKCVDAHHLLVNLRSKVCKDGLKHIDKHAWISVAEKNRDIISKSLVVDLIDKQNNAFALKTFSPEVESEMRKLEFHREADFCKLVREWYEAEDFPGIPSAERITRKLSLKSYLLENVDFGTYPVYGMYIKGFPKVMFEGFVQRIDTTMQLYSIVKSGTFNQRAVSSLVNETFFGELSEMEPTHLGCPKAVSIPRLMSTTTELFHFRSDPSKRTFKINTTKKSVYPDTVLHDFPLDISTFRMDPLTSRTITVRDHLFDKLERKRRNKEKRKELIFQNPVKYQEDVNPFDNTTSVMRVKYCQLQDLELK